MVAWIENKWDTAAAFVARHPKKSAAVGLAGAWYQAIVDIANYLWSISPTRAALIGWWNAMTWPDWDVSWITGPIGTLILVLLWWQTRHGKGPFAKVTPEGGSGRTPEQAQSGLVSDQFKQIVIERDKARDEHARCKHDFAISRIRWSAHLKQERRLKVKVTVRFAVYSDYVLANEIQTIIKANTEWPVTIDGGNKPTIKPDTRFKVVFVMGWAKSFNDIASAFNDGELINTFVATRVDEEIEQDHLVIEVLPTL